MNQKAKNNASENNASESKTSNVNQETSQPSVDRSKVVTPSEDLVYKGGYTEDPEEIVANPAVTPEMLDDQRDNRPDLTRLSEDK